MNKKEKELLNELNEVVEEQAYIIIRCADNLSIISDSFASRYGSSGSNAIEAVVTLLQVVHQTLINNVWPCLCDLKNASEKEEA